MITFYFELIIHVFFNTITINKYTLETSYNIYNIFPDLIIIFLAYSKYTNFFDLSKSKFKFSSKYKNKNALKTHLTLQLYKSLVGGGL